MKNTFRTFALGAFIPFIVFPTNSPAKDKHDDPYVQGPDGESGLVREVRHRLVMLPYYGVFDDIGFNVNGGTVTLVGEVRQPVLKADADATVRKIEGVTNVVNNLEVLPLSPQDDRVRRGCVYFRTTAKILTGDGLADPKALLNDAKGGDMKISPEMWVSGGVWSWLLSPVW